jgi:hypothetical protein
VTPNLKGTCIEIFLRHPIEEQSDQQSSHTGRPRRERNIQPSEGRHEDAGSGAKKDKAHAKTPKDLQDRAEEP